MKEFKQIAVKVNLKSLQFYYKLTRRGSAARQTAYYAGGNTYSGYGKVVKQR